MTLALDPAVALGRRPASVPPVRASLSVPIEVGGWDAMAILCLSLLWAALFLLRGEALPMQLWDESRNANNALEMALHGHWFAPTYDGVVDHWNTKPPLLIWCMAGLLKLGLPPLVALRLPSWLAAAATVATIWGVLRFALRDRMAAFVGALLLLSAWSYVGPHGARTADYDALESLFVLAGSLAVWRAGEKADGGWLLVAASAFVLGIMTKGVAGLLAGPGLVLYLLWRPSRFIRLLRDVRTWAAVALFVGVVGGYYLLREHFDPGYLRAVAGNELGGRFMKVTENHRGSWHFYLTQLALFAEPCGVLCLTALLPLFGRDGERRSLVAAAAAAALSLLLVLSASQSKMAWYITPIVPFMALASGLGVSDALHTALRRRSRFGAPLRVLLILVLAGGAAAAIWRNQTEPQRSGRELGQARYAYGGFLDAVRRQGLARDVIVLDRGFRNDAGLANYDPMLKFYADLEHARGLHVHVLHTASALAVGELAGGCDGVLLAAIERAYVVQPVYRAHGCRLERLMRPRD